MKKQTKDKALDTDVSVEKRPEQSSQLQQIKSPAKGAHDQKLKQKSSKFQQPAGPKPLF